MIPAGGGATARRNRTRLTVRFGAFALRTRGVKHEPPPRRSGTGSVGGAAAQAAPPHLGRPVAWRRIPTCYRWRVPGEKSTTRSRASMREGALLAVAVAATVGLIFAIAANRYQSWGELPDRFRGAQGYEDIGRSWADGAPLRNGRPPAYPLFLGTIIRSVGFRDYPRVAVISQALLLLGISIAGFRLGRRAGGHPLFGLAVSLLIASNLLLVRAFLGKQETVLYSAILVALFALIDRRAWRSASGCTLLGLVCALGWLTRPTGFLLAPVVGCVCFVAELRDGRAAKRGRRILAFVVAVALPMGAWLDYQVRHGYSPSLSPAHAATNLYKGNNAALRIIYPYTDVDQLKPHLAALAAQWSAQGLYPDPQFRAAAIEFMRSSPGEALALLPRKAAAFFVPIQFPLGKGRVEQGADGGWILADYRPARPGKRYSGLAALPGVICLFVALKRFRMLAPAQRFAVSIVFLTAGVHLLTFAETRFRLPFDPLLALIFAAVASGFAGRARLPRPAAT